MFALYRISAAPGHGGKLSLFKYVCSFVWVRKKCIDFGNQ